jgi:uncharacterized protein YjbI with pentapeptide repeats
MDASELLKRYTAGETVFFGLDLSFTDLSGIDLSGVSLISSDLSGTDLSGAYLNEVCLCETDLSVANLSNANLNNADLSFTDLRGADLSYAKLSGAYLSRADLIGANLFEAYLSGANLIGANLFEAYLYGADLAGANLTDANLIDADLSYANLNNANLSNANLSYASLMSADLINATLVNANLNKASLIGARLFKADLTNTNLNGAELYGTILAYKKVSEELQQENQELKNKLSLLETQFENLVSKEVQRKFLANQGIKAKNKLTWEGLRFRSEPERKIAQVLDEMGILFFPLPSGRVMAEEGMVTREVDFLICSKGIWGILECDGEMWHTSAAKDHKRDNDFKRHGLWFIQRFIDKECKKNPHKVVRQFLDMLHKFHEDQRYSIIGDFAEIESLLPSSNPCFQSEDSSI